MHYLHLIHVYHMHERRDRSTLEGRHAMKARLITCSLPSRDLAASVGFYSHLLGVEFGRSLSEFVCYYAWASAGVKLTVNDPSWKNHGVMLQFAVDDLDGAIRELVGKGGSVLVPAFPLEIPAAGRAEYKRRYEALGLGRATNVSDLLGRVAILTDPSGVALGLMQLEPYAEAFFENGEISKYELFMHDMDKSFAKEFVPSPV